MFDIDNFKNINDTYGHKTGDDVIVALADKFRELIRKSDIVAHFGGEEFLLLLPETDIQKAFFIAEKIRIEVQDMIIHHEDKKELKFTVSGGVSLVNNQTDNNIEDSIQRADKALYEAKKNGKNRICIK